MFSTFRVTTGAFPINIYVTYITLGKQVTLSNADIYMEKDHFGSRLSLCMENVRVDIIPQFTMMNFKQEIHFYLLRFYFGSKISNDYSNWGKV